MERNANKLISIWKSSLVEESVQSALGVSIEDLNSAMAQIFCPGPFYFFVFDFSKLDFTYVHPKVEEVLGYSTKEMTIQQHLQRLHPEDQAFVQTYEQMAGDFLYNQITPENLKKYKISYFLRLRNKKGEYRLILHQVVVLQLNENKEILTTLGTHSDVSHLFSEPSRSISYIGLFGEPSYMGIKVEKKPAAATQLNQSQLTKREMEILQLLAEGDTVKEISEKVFLAEDTVRTHRNNIRKKLNCKNTTQAVAQAIRKGWI